jgi:hypothetical protein
MIYMPIPASGEHLSLDTLIFITLSSGGCIFSTHLEVPGPGPPPNLAKELAEEQTAGLKGQLEVPCTDEDSEAAEWLPSPESM